MPRELFETIFLPHAAHPAAYKKDFGYLTVEYPDNSGASIYTGYADDDPAQSSRHGDRFGMRLAADGQGPFAITPPSSARRPRS